MLKLLADIFLSFFKIGLFTLGGGLAIVSLVQQEMIGRGWLSNSQFMDILGIAQMTPGPIGVNTATFVGYRVAEIQGSPWWAAALISLFATLSVTSPSVIGVHFGGGWFARHRDAPCVRSVFSVLRPLVAGFVTAAGTMLALECFGAADVYSLGNLAFGLRDCIVFAVTLAITLSGKLSPIWGLAFGATLGLVAM